LGLGNPGNTRPGKRLHNELENHHAINGKIHDFDWAMASMSQTLSHYQRVWAFLKHQKGGFRRDFATKMTNQQRVGFKQCEDFNIKT